jgi:hypothetical protein
MIKILWYYKFLNVGCDPRMVLAGHVIYTNTNLVYPTWLSSTSMHIVCVHYIYEAPNSTDDCTFAPCNEKRFHNTLSYIHAHCLHIWFGLVGTLFSSYVFTWGTHFYSMFIFYYVSSQRSMIKLLWHYKFLHLESDRGMVLVSQVICTNTNHVHPIWLTGSIPRLCVSNVSMRRVFDLPLCIP